MNKVICRIVNAGNIYINLLFFFFFKYLSFVQRFLVVGLTWCKQALWFRSSGPVCIALCGAWETRNTATTGDGVGMSEVAVVREQWLRLSACPIEGWTHCQTCYIGGHHQAWLGQTWRGRRWVTARNLGGEKACVKTDGNHTGRKWGSKNSAKVGVINIKSITLLHINKRK